MLIGVNAKRTLRYGTSFKLWGSLRTETRVEFHTWQILEVPLSFKYSCAYFIGVVDEKYILTFRLVKKHFQDDE